MALRDFLEKRMEKSRRLKEMQEEARLNKVVEQRMKSPQERDLEAFIERQRQENIKMKLQEFKDKEKQKILSGNLMSKDNMFKGHKNILNAPKMFPMKSTQNSRRSIFFK